MIVGVYGAPATVDPYAPDASALTWALARPVWPSLYRLAPDGSPVPYLAQELRTSPRGARVTLRPARWSDGEPITASDVVESAERARPPSGFAGLRVTAVDDATVLFTGHSRDWEQRLARLTFVLRNGRVNFAPAPSGGPFELHSVTSGLGVELRRNASFFGSPAQLHAISIRYADTTDVLLALLDEGRLDVAWLPATVNLVERLDALGLEHAERFGSETVALETSGVTNEQRAALDAAINAKELERFFARDLGKPVAGRGRPGPLPQEVSLAAPTGDELLMLLQRALFESLSARGINVETLSINPTTVYSGRSRADLTLRRSSGDHGSPIPLFRVASVVAWRPSIHGIDVNPTLEGPLWDAQTWTKRVGDAP